MFSQPTVSPNPTPARREIAGSDEGTGVLCRSCWQASIMEERKTKVSRLKNYRRRHPTRAQAQCNGKTWW